MLKKKRDRYEEVAAEIGYDKGFWTLILGIFVTIVVLFQIERHQPKTVTVERMGEQVVEKIETAALDRHPAAEAPVQTPAKN